MLSINPRNAEAYALWGNMLAEQKHFDGAIGKFQPTLDIYPKHAWALRSWVEILRRQGKFEEAEAKLRDMVSANPRLPPSARRARASPATAHFETLANLQDALPARTAVSKISRSWSRCSWLSERLARPWPQPACRSRKLVKVARGC